MHALRRTTLVIVLALAGAVTWAPAVARAQPVPGYWLAGADGGVFAFGAPFYGSGSSAGSAACGFTPQAPSTLNGREGCTAIGAVSSGSGYWLLNMFRQATGFGGAGFVGGSHGCTSLNGASGKWVGMASSSTGAGYWLVASDGGVMGCGDAPPPYGVVSGEPLAAPIVGMAATPGDLGYWLVAADGGVFAFGDARFQGSMGGTPLNAPVVGIAAVPSGQGYWLAAADGGVFAFGVAPFQGSMAGKPLDAPVVGIAPALGPSGCLPMARC
jgi:hypothetical protein